MDQRIVQFIGALRASGVRISLAESEDAFHAVEHMGVQDREAFRISLRTTLVKDASDLARFELLFPLFFQHGEPPNLLNPAENLTPEEAKMLAKALRQFSQDLRRMLEKLLKGEPLSQQELDRLDQLLNAEGETDLRYQNWLARQMEKALKFSDVRKAMEELMQLLREMGMSKQRLEQLRRFLQSNQQALQEQLRQYAGQRIAEKLSEEPRQERLDNLYNRPFHMLSEDEMDQLRREIQRLAAALRTAGYRLAATSGTAEALAIAGHEARLVAKLGAAEGDPGEPILELIASGEVRLVVNTPTPRSGAVRDAADIRHAATAEGILCLTAIETAVAAAEALDPSVAGLLAEVRSLLEWMPRAPEPVALAPAGRESGAPVATAGRDGRD